VKSNGTNASWLGTVKPLPMSNFARSATTSASMQAIAAGASHASRVGGNATSSSTSAITKPPLTTISARRSAGLSAWLLR
jgi:hypothetical protein